MGGAYVLKEVAELYDFARDIGVSLLVANYSRYVIDLNRSSTDEVLYPGQVVTGLCRTQTFAGEDIYGLLKSTEFSEETYLSKRRRWTFCSGISGCDGSFLCWTDDNCWILKV